MEEDQPNEFKIHLFDDWYIGKNTYEYHIYQPRVIDGRDGKKHLGHYSNIPGLLEGITNLILKHRSTAQSFEELEQNLISIRGLIESIQQTIKEAE